MKSIALGNDLEFVFALYLRADTGLREPATGLTGLTVCFSAHDAGTAYPGTTVTLSEQAALPGTYVGTLSGTDLTTALAGVGTAFRVLTLSGGRVLASDEVRIDAVRRLD